jgi:hypothetical protein
MRKRAQRGSSGLAETRPAPQRVLTDFERLLVDILPKNWLVSVEPTLESPSDSAASPSPRPDGVIMVRAPDGTQSMIIYEAKRTLDPKLVPAVADQLARYQRNNPSRSMVVSSFLSRRARELLKEADIGYADATGNLRLVLDSPAVFIEKEGAQADPWGMPGDRPLRSLKGPTAGRIVRALIDFRPPYGVEQLAKRSGTSLGSVSRVFSLLESDVLIVRARRGPVTDVKWPDLIRRWTDDYTFAHSNRVHSFLEPRGLPALLQKLQAGPARYAITGSLAATRVAPITVSRLATVYVDDAEVAAEQLHLRRAETGGNVVLAEPFDEVVFDRVQTHAGVQYSAFSQVAADLLTGPGRSPSEGDALIRWMQEHEDAWRD